MLDLGLVTAFMDWKGSPSAILQESCDNFDQSNCCRGVTMCTRCSKMCQEISQTCTREEEHRLPVPLADVTWRNKRNLASYVWRNNRNYCLL